MAKTPKSKIIGVGDIPRANPHADKLAKLKESRARLIELARVNGAAFNAMVLKDELTGQPVRMAPMHRKWHQLADRHDRLNIISHVEAAKALALDTPIPTPDGWRTMGELRVGDRVFARDGSITSITNATEVMHNHRCYRVRFVDGSEVIADAEHLWLAWTDDRYAKNQAPLEVTTEEMLKRGVTVGTKPRAYPAYRWRVPIAEAAQYPERKLPLHPYVLGAWLGDGSKDCGRLTYHPDDRFIFDRCLELTGLKGGNIGRKATTAAVSQGLVTDPGHQGVGGGLTSMLRPLGVLHNKHIPEEYMLASEEQRLELLAGLMDTDGTIDPLKSRAVFCSSIKAFAEQVLELVRSLGFKAALRDHKTYFLVAFTAYKQVFRLPRKAARVQIKERSKELSAKSIMAIEPVESVPVRCIQVAHEDHTYLCGRSYTVTHNSQNLSVGRILFELGKNPNTRCVIVSNTMMQAQKLLKSIASYIERSEELHEIFPNLKPNPTGPWTLTQLAVERKGHPKDPSVQSTGVHGAITGARIDLLVLDDILDYENARTPAGREDLWNWVHSALFGRLTEHARVISVGNAYHRDDFLHRIEKNSLWHTVRFPVINDEGESSWPERWPLERISRKREELGPLEFARQMLCQARDDAESRFQKEWVDLCLMRGNGRSLQHAVATPPPGCAIYTGVDLAVQQHSSADLTAFTTILVYPNGDREILNIETGRLAGPQIVDKIKELYHRYQGIFFVENNQAQDFIVQFLRSSTAIPVKPFTTGRNKVHPEFGVESIAAEMAAGKWVIPNRDGKMHSEVEALVNEMLYYDPKSHTGDRLMSCLPPGELVTTSRGLVAIEDVCAGDLVLTHQGRFRKVTGLESREYTGDLVEIKPAGMLPVKVTTEHPIWAAKARFLRDGTNRLVPDQWDWLDAADLRAGSKLSGMYVFAPTASTWGESQEEKSVLIDLAPFTQERERKQAWGARWKVEAHTLQWGKAAPIPRHVILDEQAAMLCGLFLAEGTAHHHQVSFAFHEQERHLAAFVIEHAQRLFGATCAIDTRKNSRGVSVRINSTLACRFFRMLGKTEGKSLPWDWMGLPLPLRLAVFRGWLMGDGHLRTSPEGNRYLSAVSVAPALLRQAQMTFHEAGLSVAMAPFKQSGFFQGKPCGQRPAWRISLSWADTSRLLAAPLPVEQAHWDEVKPARERTNSRSMRIENGMAVRLASVERIPYNGKVYNLHVEEDESFVAGGIAVHNCWFAREAARQGNIRAEVGYLPTMRR